MSLARAREQLRKDDARRKIALGGLVIKSGLDAESEAVILGAMIEAVAALSGPTGDNIRARLAAAGKGAFDNGRT